MIIDKACYDRGCACYDGRIDKDGVEVFREYEAEIQRLNLQVQKQSETINKLYKTIGEMMYKENNDKF